MMRTDGVWGFYPIVDRAERVRWLVGRGVKTIQLRVKDLQGDLLRAEIAEALEAAPGCQLFINDHWALALQFGAAFVHLGQEDLDGADREALQHVGLGVSTHSEAELERGLGWNPAYVALGPVWPTTLKQMPWGPQGTAKLTTWRARAQRPLVAIGGVTLERAPEALAAGADAIAIVSDIQRESSAASDARVDAWLALFASR